MVHKGNPEVPHKCLLTQKCKEVGLGVAARQTEATLSQALGFSTSQHSDDLAIDEQ